MSAGRLAAVPSRRVVITGLGVVSPVGNTVEEFWDSLKNGRSGVGPVTHFDASSYPSRVAGEVKDFHPEEHIDVKTLRHMDGFVRYAMVAALEAVSDSGLEITDANRDRVGVLVGSGVGGLKVLEDQHQILLERGPRRVSPFFIPMLIIDMASGQISIRLGAKGPNLAVATACASASHAIGEATRIIIHGDADVMIAGGAESAVTPLGLAGFCAAKTLSTARNDEPEKASRPFDRDRDGFVLAEGAGIVVLEELEHARKRGAEIYAEVAGYGLSGDAYHQVAPDPTGGGPARAMIMALRDAGVGPEDLDYVNAHGTSTALNDPMETRAMKIAFGEEAAKKIPVSSTKSMTGHLLGAAGGVELVACALAMRDGVIPPTINYENPDPECDLDYVPNVAREARIDVCMSNSLGFGGHNASLVLRRLS